jgi:hypothetical protein
MSLEDAIIHAVTDCRRNGVRATATTVQPRLPETMAYSRDWIKVMMSNMARHGKLMKVGKHKGYAPSGYCGCCGAPLGNHAFAS